MNKSLLIIGRPNVGKSSLFNRLLGAKKAIVHNRRGVTRDLQEAEALWGKVSYRLIDTAGLEESLDQMHTDPEDVRARTLIERALQDAAQILFVLDAQKGVTIADVEIAGWLRRFDKPIQLLLNKSEGAIGDSATEAFRLGFGEATRVSATHNIGITDLMQEILPNLQKDSIEFEPEAPDLKDLGRPLRLAILGRPNVGKSSIINGLLGFERQVTGNIAGLTRDAIEIPWQEATEEAPGWNLVDTAGLRSHGQYRDSLDRATARETWLAIARADVVALVVEADEPLTRGDLAIAKDCATQGRPMVLVVNKTDLCADPKGMADELRYSITKSLAQIRQLPYLCISALKDRGLDKIAQAAELQATRAAQRIGTGVLNRWLEEMLARHPMPLVKGRRMRIKYVTQAAVSPPEFIFFTAHKTPIPEAYLRYLRNGLVDQFGFEGIPIRLNRRRGENPYDAEEVPQNRQKHRANSRLLPKKAQRKVSHRKTGKKALSLKQRAKQR